MDGEVVLRGELSVRQRFLAFQETLSHHSHDNYGDAQTRLYGQLLVVAKEIEGEDVLQRICQHASYQHYQPGQLQPNQEQRQE